MFCFVLEKQLIAVLQQRKKRYNTKLKYLMVPKSTKMLKNDGNMSKKQESA